MARKPKLEKSEKIFTVDVEAKKEWLQTQKTETGKNYEAILFKADEYERLLNKPIYDFNIDERDDFLIVKFRNKSEAIVRSTISPIRKYIDFCINKNMVRHMENRFATITGRNYLKYVNNQSLEARYIPREEIINMQNKLVNVQDKLILELIPLGVRGRTEEGETHEELVNLRIDDINFEEKILNLTRNDGEMRYIDINDNTLKLLRDTINSNVYIANNGIKKEGKPLKLYPINKTKWVFRTAGKNKSGKVNFGWFTQRIVAIQEWLGKPYLTIGNLFYSGMIDYARKRKELNGELTKQDYKDINKHFQYGENNEVYWHKVKQMVELYIK